MSADCRAPWAAPAPVHRSDDTLEPPVPCVFRFGALVVLVEPSGAVVLAVLDPRPLRATRRIGRPPRSTSPACERLAVRFPAAPGRPVCQVLLRLTADERALIERAAGGRPVSAWIREACGGSPAGGSVGVRDRCLDAARRCAAAAAIRAG